MNSAVDVLFDYGRLIINSFSGLIDFFTQPVTVGIGKVFTTGLVPELLGGALERIGVTGTKEFSLIGLMLGPGLIFFLVFTLIKWFLDVVL